MARLISAALTAVYLCGAISAASAGWNDDQKTRWGGGAQRDCTEKGKCPK